MSTLSVEVREEILHGGTTNFGLVTRVGDTVRRPLRPTSEATHALLDHLERVGFEGVPRFLGIDHQGREVLSYVAGYAVVKPYPAPALSDAALESVARLIRDYHAAVATFDPHAHSWSHALPSEFQGGIVCHNDLNLDNVIFSGDRAVALIDFDLAGPGCVGWDLAGSARLWAPLEITFDQPQITAQALRRLGRFADAYGATSAQREQLVQAMVPCHDWCYGIVADAAEAGHEIFSLEWRTGGRERIALTRQWLLEHAAQLRAALGLDVQ
jgi:Phosphotransferase enzyme family